jgi:hypothetical protein
MLAVAEIFAGLDLLGLRRIELRLRGLEGLERLIVLDPSCIAVLQEFALAVFLGLAAGRFGFGCSDLGFRDLEVLMVLLRVEPGEEVALLHLRPDVNLPLSDLAVDLKADVGLIARLDLAVQRYLLPPSCNSAVTVRTGRTARDAAFSPLWQAAKTDSKTRVPAAPSARVASELSAPGQDLFHTS